jgi:hypothetical protein
MSEQRDMFVSVAAPGGPKVEVNHSSEIRGNALKSAGRRFAAQSAGTLLDRARNVAAQIAAEKGTVTADDVRKALQIPPKGPGEQNYLGSLFKDPRFVPTGKFVASRLQASRGRMIRQWRLR